jgi:hypothetical protein
MKANDILSLCTQKDPSAEIPISTTRFRVPATPDGYYHYSKTVRGHQPHVTKRDLPICTTWDWWPRVVQTGALPWIALVLLQQ